MGLKAGDEWFRYGPEACPHMLKSLSLQAAVPHLGLNSLRPGAVSE